MRGTVPQTGLAELLVAMQPLVERRAADPVIPARQRDVARHLLSVTEHRQPMPNLALLFPFVHPDLQSQETPDVNDLRQS
jgi:hypothetical protein